MTGFWPAIWGSPGRATAAGCLLSVVIASVLYAFNWHTFYDTRTLEARQAAAGIAADIGALATATADEANGHDQRFQAALRDYLDRRHPRVTVRRLQSVSPGRTDWELSNNAPIDASRSQLEESFLLGNEAQGQLQVTIREGIRPSLTTALARAWTFSLADYAKSPAIWWNRALYNRSVPLYGYLLTVVVIGFGTVRALYRDQQELLRLDTEGRRITSELEQLRESHAQEVESFREQMSGIRSQREDACQERDRLQEEIAGIDTEYRGLVEGAPTEPGTSTVAVRLRDNAARRSQARLTLASYNEQVAHFESKLAKAQANMQAAEYLVHEVDDKRKDLVTRLQDRNREIRKLRNLVQQARKETHSLQLLSAQPRSSEESADVQTSQDYLEQQLAQWVKSPGQAKISFSEHSRARDVEQQLKRIDGAFLDRYFTHIVNAEYQRGTPRLIRVVGAAEDSTDTSQGELIVALDDDAGRTLGMRFSTRGDAPETVQVGFVLAMLLRGYCRDFRNFMIRSR